MPRPYVYSSTIRNGIRCRTEISIVIAGALLASFGMMSCRRPAVQEPQRPESILVAAGGGYTGRYTGYVLHRNGVVEAWSQMPGRPDSATVQCTFGSDTTEYFFARLRFIGFERMTQSTPGNLTRLIRTTDPDRTHEVRWGDAGQSPPQSVTSFYDEFMLVVQTRLGLR